MKDKLEWFITKANLFYVGLVVFIISFLMATPILAIPTSLLEFSFYEVVLFITVISLFVGIFIIPVTWLARKSYEFWEYAEIVKKLAEDAQTKEEVESIYDDHFKKLQSMSFGNIHSNALTEIYTILKTKYNFYK